MYLKHLWFILVQPSVQIGKVANAATFLIFLFSQMHETTLWKRSDKTLKFMFAKSDARTKVWQRFDTVVLYFHFRVNAQGNWVT